MTTQRRGLLISAHDLGPYWVRLAREAGLTTLGLHPVPGVPADDPRSFESLLERLDSPEFVQLVRHLQGEGIEVTLEAHALHWLLPRDAFAAHPEWFRLDEDGRRNSDLNLCASNEEALDVVAKRGREVAERLGGTFGHRYHLWMDDNSRSCHCPRCQGLSASDQALLVYNSLLSGIRRADPQGTVAYLAYQGTLSTPTKVSPLPGIFVEFAPVDRDSRYPLAYRHIPKNVEAAAFLPGLLQFFGSAGSQVLEYWMDNSYFYRWTPPYGELPFYRGVIRRDVQYYRSLGFENLTAFACGLNQDYEREYGPPLVGEYGSILAEEFS